MILTFQGLGLEMLLVLNFGSVFWKQTNKNLSHNPLSVSLSSGRVGILMCKVVVHGKLLLAEKETQLAGLRGYYTCS